MSQPTYTLGQCLETAACTGCRACADVCPAVRAAGDGELSALFRMQGLRRILGARAGGWLARLLRTRELTDAEWEHFAGTVFRCTLCGNCQEVCPAGIRLKDLWISLRRDLTAAARSPKKIEMIRKNLLGSRNVFDEDNEERADWTEDMEDEPEDKLCRDCAEVVYFTGCTAAYFPVAQKIPLALAEVFSAGKVDYAIMGQDEWCCGFPLLGAGLGDLAQEFIAHNLDAVAKRGAKTVVFACPSCYAMWLEHYPYRERGLRIMHATQFLRELITEKKIALKNLDLTVTYHDPCDLGRTAHEYDAPRDVLKAIPGVNFVELPNCREACNCCGGGGNLEMVDAGLSADIAKAKVAEVVSTGASAVVTGCQQCVRTMLTYAKRNKVPLEVLDIAQLVRKALKD